jgi:hypothetical protein
VPRRRIQSRPNISALIDHRQRDQKRLRATKTAEATRYLKMSGYRIDHELAKHYINPTARRTHQTDCQSLPQGIHTINHLVVRA